MRLQYIFINSPEETLIIDKFSIDMTTSKIKCLNPSQPHASQWINDEVINFYLEMLAEKYHSDTNNLHIFSTFFMEYLSPTATNTSVTSFNYTSIARWTHSNRNNINIFKKTKVLIPINYHNQHWTLATIYPQRNEVSYYDSMNGHQTAQAYLRIIQQYLSEEAKATNPQTTFIPTEWTFSTASVPQQSNCHDCGIYVMLFAHLIVQDFPIESINPIDIPKIRTSIAYAIQTGTVSQTIQHTESFAQEQRVTNNPSILPIRSNLKRKAAFTGTYNEDHIIQRQRNQPIEFPRPSDLHFHPTDTYANQRSGIATSRIAQGGLGLFAVQECECEEIVGFMFGGLPLTKENIHLHLPSLYSYFDEHNNIYIDPYDPSTKTIFCSAAYANDNIQQPELNNTEFVTLVDRRVALRTIRKVFKYEEFSTPYGPDHWYTLLYSLSLLLTAQHAYHKEHDPAWIKLINTKRSMEELITPPTLPVSTLNPNPNPDPNPDPNPNHTSDIQPHQTITHPSNIPSSYHDSIQLDTAAPEPQTMLPQSPSSLTEQPTHTLPPSNTLTSNPPMTIPRSQLRHVISFTSHVDAINYLQSQNLRHPTWINHQLNQLRMLETQQPQLHSGFTTVQLELQLSINAYDNYSTYSPNFHLDEIYHMLYYIPSIGIFTPTKDNMIQLQHLSNNPNNTFSLHTQQLYITNNPTICLISTTGIDIYQLSDTYSNQHSLNITTTGTKRYIKQETSSTEQPPAKKIYKTTLQSRLTKNKWYHKNKIPLLHKLRQKNNKTGIIHILNENPDTNIEQLLQQTNTTSPATTSIPSSLIPTTTKSWTEVLNYDPTVYEQPKHKTYKKRKSDQLTKEFKTSESSRKRGREQYYDNKDDILDKRQSQRKHIHNNVTNSQNITTNPLIHPDPLPNTNSVTITTNIDTNNRLLNNTEETSKRTTTPTITDYFKKKITPKDDKKPP
jgi:hypothetical protein